MYYICENNKVFFNLKNKYLHAPLGAILPLLRRHGTQRPKVTRVPRP